MKFIEVEIDIRLSRHWEGSRFGRVPNWEVFGRRLFIFGWHLGWVYAVDRDGAILEAKSKWPREKKLYFGPVNFG